jgi:hypothetical protein
LCKFILLYLEYDSWVCYRANLIAARSKDSSAPFSPTTHACCGDPVFSWLYSIISISVCVFIYLSILVWVSIILCYINNIISVYSHLPFPYPTPHSHHSRAVVIPFTVAIITHSHAHRIKIKRIAVLATRNTHARPMLFPAQILVLGCSCVYRNFCG